MIKPPFWSNAVPAKVSSHLPVQLLGLLFATALVAALLLYVDAHHQLAVYRCGPVAVDPLKYAVSQPYVYRVGLKETVRIRVKVHESIGFYEEGRNGSTVYLMQHHWLFGMIHSKRHGMAYRFLE